MNMIIFIRHNQLTDIGLLGLRLILPIAPV